MAQFFVARVRRQQLVPLGGQGPVAWDRAQVRWYDERAAGHLADLYNVRPARGIVELHDALKIALDFRRPALIAEDLWDQARLFDLPSHIGPPERWRRIP